MKRLIFTIIIFISVTTFNQSLAYDSTVAKFYPLAIGNVWSYHRIDRTGQNCIQIVDEYDYVVRITVDTIMPNSKRYFRLSGSPYGTSYQRIDSVTMRVYQYSGSGECTLDSLLAKRNNYFSSCRQYASQPFLVLDTNYINFAGSLRPAKNIQGNQLIGHHYILMYGIGLYSEGLCEFGGSTDFLNGCIINGIQYGQMLGVQNGTREIPLLVNLYQNYPNPFNPSTKIKFAIPAPLNPPLRVESSTEGGTLVRIVIYDALGREVATLVNEQLNPGTYEVEWDAGNFPSGVYFYKLETTEFSEAKKMILIK